MPHHVQKLQSVPIKVLQHIVAILLVMALMTPIITVVLPGFILRHQATVQPVTLPPVLKLP
jgi:hypothetical protein